MENCIFCKIINKEIPATIVFENDRVIAFKDISPQAPIHVVIIPKIHIRNVLELNNTNIDYLKDIHLAAQEIAQKLGISESGFRLINNCGADAGQTVFHLHYHLLGGKSLGAKLL